MSVCSRQPPSIAFLRSPWAGLSPSQIRVSALLNASPGITPLASPLRATFTIYLITDINLRQQSVAAEALGRTATVWKMAASIIAPMGVMLGALVADVAAWRVLEVPPKPR